MSPARNRILYSIGCKYIFLYEGLDRMICLVKLLRVVSALVSRIVPLEIRGAEVTIATNELPARNQDTSKCIVQCALCLWYQARHGYVSIAAWGSLFPGPYTCVLDASMPTEKAERWTVDDLVARNICPVKKEYARPFQTTKQVDSIGSAAQVSAAGAKKKSKKRARQVLSHDKHIYAVMLPVES